MHSLSIILGVISALSVSNAVAVVPVAVGPVGGGSVSPVVQTAEGAVQGSTMFTAEGGTQFYAFQGIPFAKSPTGPLRFKAPEPADPWSGVLLVIEDTPPCMQPSFNIFNPGQGVEDCLQLNVFTPQLPDSQSNPSLTVQVYIHGGGFFEGHSEYLIVNPERYMNTEMVVVVLKYRLGALGFLSTDDEAASGNFGLLDQHLALQWVQRNIAAFGGNPNDVTLTGQSAGSASVIYHYLSPMSAGLFHRAIAESGSAINPWAMQENPAQYAKEMGEHFDCPTDNTALLIDCLRHDDAEDIVTQSLHMMLKDLTLVFVPSVETSPSGQFLTENPMTILETGNFNRVPLQLGFTRDEGCIIYDAIFFFFRQINNNTFDVIIPVLLHALSDYRNNLINISYAIKQQYYSGVNYDNATEVNIATINWISDIAMKSGISQTAALVSSHGVPTNLYSFNYVSKLSRSHFTGEPDVNHGSELRYLWYVKLRNDKDIEFGNRFFNLWVEFIQTGNHLDPEGDDEQWLPTSSGQYNYYDIDEQFVMRGNYDTENMNFWWYTVPSIANA